ncbi:imidazole glycerol phosphate synthase subunit HisF [Vibrio cholerae]|uniref:AglZ/HisF2 family acetamidino modification protein n=1 Tax=Vibrio cholerae TaxID=666 RepID=UPI00115993A4|nr:AglZ/HisF2 family acetamidino modification protein [Vibrio cholerae]TQP20015.1 imidazole glycerol phosphate synthase cyclase subunit [Vibrio cholerae]CAB1259796.1 imidazole glycerol phosphate synthase subunit HisF [Vibrio cholerae]
MLKSRVIPCLLLDDNRLVKTCKFKNAKYIGDPINAIRVFNEKEVDELLLIDISATKSGKGPNYELIEEIAGECFMPLCYGGGITTFAQAKQIFSSGVEKISIQNCHFTNPEIVRKIVSEYGSQSVVASIDLKKNFFGNYKIYDYKNKRYRSEPWQDYIIKLQGYGVGELLINFVDNDGMMSGMALEVIKEASALLKIPLVTVGGVGCLEDIKNGVLSGASAIGVGSFFVFHGPHKAVLISYPNYYELEELLNEDK